jgi:transposase InsO family protein
VQIDLVDMQKYSGLNNGYNWILTYVDLFSKFAQARPLKSKHVKNVMEAMDDIFKNNPVSFRPRTIQADNGSEFKNQFEKHMKSKYNIRVIHSQAYNPSSQGAVERFNKTIKSMIYQFMTRFDSKRWIDLLPSLIANYNSTMHSSTRQKPIDIMGNMKDSALVTQVYDRLKKKAEKVIEGNDSGETFVIGDSVRVLLTSDARKRKNQFEKRIAQNWSNDVYQVRSVSKPTEQYNQPQYLLMKGTRKLTKRYYNWHLLRVDPNQLHDDIKPIADRPVFDTTKFDKEKHLRTGKIKNIKVDTVLPAAEKRARSSRAIKKPARFKD